MRRRIGVMPAPPPPRFNEIDMIAGAPAGVQSAARRGGAAMRVHCLCVQVTAAMTLSIVPSFAGPCSPEIDRLQSGVDALIAAAGVAGPAGRQSTAAMTHRQPTPSSIAAAEARLKEGARTE